MRRMENVMMDNPSNQQKPEFKEKPKSISSLEDIVTTLEMQAPGLNTPIKVAEVARHLNMAKLVEEDVIALVFFVFGTGVADKIKGFLEQDKFKKLGVKVHYVDLPDRLKKIDFKTMKNIKGLSVTKGELLGGDQD